MEADIDFDVIAHLGFIRNIDVASRGVYFVRLTLLYGEDEQRVAPIGLFSAPSRLDSFVADQRVPPPPFLNVCHIDNEDQTFRCRSFVIRYRDEKHELNDGVHWRLTIPQVDLMSWRGGVDLLNRDKSKTGKAAPPQNVDGMPGGLLFEDTLQIHCELFHAPLMDAPPGTNMMFDIAAVIPRNPEFEVVSSQKIAIQNNGWSGFHEYFPVRFERSHCVDLDLMVHCGITDIKYNKLSFGVLPASERALHLKKVNSSAPGGTAATPRIMSAPNSSRPSIPDTENSVGSVSVQDTSGKAASGGENEEGEYPAGIGIWYTKSNVEANELSPTSSAQPIRSKEIIESYLSPIEGDSNRTPEKHSPAFNNVTFDTPDPSCEEQYYDDGSEDQASPLNQRASYKPPRKSFTPGPMSAKKHKKASSMPILPTKYDAESNENNEEEVVLADNMYSPPESPLANHVPAKTPASRKSYQPSRKSFTPGPNSMSARKAAREGPREQPQVTNMALLFSSHKASPARVVADPALHRDLVDEDDIPEEDYSEDIVNGQHSVAAQTGYSYDQRFDNAMVEESLRDVSISIDFPEDTVLSVAGKLDAAAEFDADCGSGFDIHVPVIHTQTPSPQQSGTGRRKDESGNETIAPILIRHQISTIVDRSVSVRNSPTPPASASAPYNSNSKNSPSVSKASTSTPPTANVSETAPNSSASSKLSKSPKRKKDDNRADDGMLSYGRAFDVPSDTGAPSPYFAGGAHSIPGPRKGPRRITACGVELDDVHALLCSYFGPIIANEDMLVAGMEWILKLLSKQSNGNAQSKQLPTNKGGIEIITAELTSAIMSAVSTSSLKTTLLQHTNSSSLDTCAGLWKQLFVALPKVMPVILPVLKKRYLKIIQGYWKEQMMVHTCRDTNMTKVHPAEASAAQLLEAMLRIEGQHGFLTSGYQVATESGPELSKITNAMDGQNVAVTPFTEGTALSLYSAGNDDLLSPPLVIETFYQPVGAVKGQVYRGLGGEAEGTASNSPHFYLPARGMRLYDPSVHKLATRLPTIVIQQYISNRKLNETTPPKLVMYKPREGIQRGGPLIGVEPTPLAIAMKMHHTAEQPKQTRAAADSQLNSVKMSLQDEFSEEYLDPKGATSVPERYVETSRSSSSINMAVYNDDDPTESGSVSKVKGPHIVILQHGFKGSAYDMRLLRNAITMMFPDNTQVYAAESNEKESEVSIELMGQRLAIEVHQYIKSREPKMLKDPARGRVSFIGHSVGGLIIRKALESELLKPLLCKLHLYLSLASPHLGTLYADSQLVSTGMWALFKLQKAPVLKELSLDDVRRDDMTKSLLYRLSENGMFMYFKWVVFASSPKDQYVPHYSARVQVSTKAVADARTGPAIVSMAANVMAQTDPSRLFRVSIDNNTGIGGNLNNIIGRTAHICYLDNPVVVEQLVYSLAGFFQ